MVYPMISRVSTFNHAFGGLSDLTGELAENTLEILDLKLDHWMLIT